MSDPARARGSRCGPFPFPLLLGYLGISGWFFGGAELNLNQKFHLVVLVLMAPGVVHRQHRRRLPDQREREAAAVMQKKLRRSR